MSFSLGSALFELVVSCGAVFAGSDSSPESTEKTSGGGSVVSLLFAGGTGGSLAAVEGVVVIEGVLDGGGREGRECGNMGE